MNNLVIVRAGDNSLHPTWLPPPGGRNWDIIVSYYGCSPDNYHQVGVRRIDRKGLKFPALHDVIRDLGDALNQYDYVWLPDDDLAIAPGSINMLFDLCRRYQFDLSQPALTPDSFFFHPVTIQNRAFMLRFTNFVEIMAPCFSRSFLQACHASFVASQSGWGLDFLWPTRITDPAKVAIIDSVGMRHTRPLGGPLYDALAKRGINAADEMRLLLKSEGILPAIAIRGGIDLDGKVHAIWNKGHHQLIKLIIAGCLPQFGHRPDVVWGLIAPLIDTLAAEAHLL